MHKDRLPLLLLVFSQQMYKYVTLRKGKEHYQQLPACTSQPQTLWINQLARRAETCIAIIIFHWFTADGTTI